MNKLGTGWVARLSVDATRSGGIVDAIAECIDDTEAAVSLFELEAGTWGVELYFARRPDLVALRALVAVIAGSDAATELMLHAIEARDWVAASLANLPPVTAGRFLVHGTHHRGHLPAAGVAIEVEAALAFGTGHHATTRGCLLALDARLRRQAPRRLAPSAKRRARAGVLDIGTGTGVLSIAAAKTLRRHILASDIDPVAVRTARANARANGVAGLIEVVTARGVPAPRFARGRPHALIFANILLTPVVRLAPSLARLAGRATAIVLSGLLREHANAALAAYRLQGLHLVRRIELEGWTTLVIVRGGAAPRPKAHRPGRRPLPGR